MLSFHDSLLWSSLITSKESSLWIQKSRSLNYLYPSPWSYKVLIHPSLSIWVKFPWFQSQITSFPIHVLISTKEFSCLYLELASYFPTSQDYTSSHLKYTCQFHLKFIQLLKFETLTPFTLYWSQAWVVCFWLSSRWVRVLRLIILGKYSRALLSAVSTLVKKVWCFWFYPPSLWFQIWFVSFDPQWWSVFSVLTLKAL